MRKMITVICAVLLCLAFAVAAVADTVVASVTAKPAPDVTTGSESNSAAIEVKDETGKVVASTETVKIEVTAVATVMENESQQDDTADGNTETAATEPVSEEVAKELKAAYEELSDEKTDVVAIVSGLDEVLKENNVEASNLVVKDLFHIDIADENVKEYLAVEGNTVTLNLKADIQEGQFVTVAVLVDGEWILVEDVVVLEDGTIDVTLGYLGTIAIFVDGSMSQTAELGA